MTYDDMLSVSRSLNEPEGLAEGLGNEYLRGQVALIADCFGKLEMPVDERMDEVLADLRTLTCRACGFELSCLNGEAMVEIRQQAPAGAPAQDANCDDEESWRCANVHCPRFAHPVELPYGAPEED